ncbi:MAG TPA: 4-hydroxy-tetrahydrodipicolinate reductase [Flavobacteriales bacterium]|nr:4-hydroxy-tetrahydrodipicolinate reductase [Flavobacteriales bacterium]
MKLALLGYGKMGKAIKKIALERGHHIVMEANSSTAIDQEDLKKADVAIEFSTPETVVDNIVKCFNVNLPVVVGTTGWDNHLPDLQATCKRQNQALFYASNFSIGVNIFFKINILLAKLMNEQENYDVAIKETHHTEKLDTPSGTAITLANSIIENNNKKSGWADSETDKKGEVLISAFREKDVPGTHVITYDSDIDRIEIKHEAKNRKGFATGAVLAAEWLKEKKGVYTMNDLLKL